MIEIAVDEEEKRLHLVINGIRYEDPVYVLPVALSGVGADVYFWRSTPLLILTIGSDSGAFLSTRTRLTKSSNRKAC